MAAIKGDLADKGLTTRPAFTEGSVEDEIALVPVAAESTAAAPAAGDDTEDVFQQAPATLRIGSLPPPKIVSVLPTASLVYAKSLMLNRQFSQLAVIDDSGRFLGAVSWESIGKAQIASEQPSLADTIGPAPVVDHDALLLEQIDVIYNRGFVFVQNADRSRVGGIVTAADLTRQFGNVARPFVLTEEAENRLRRRAGEVYELGEPLAAVSPSQRPRVHKVSDLTFGNYVHLMRPKENWAKLAWNSPSSLPISRTRIPPRKPAKPSLGALSGIAHLTHRRESRRGEGHCARARTDRRDRLRDRPQRAA